MKDKLCKCGIIYSETPEHLKHHTEYLLKLINGKKNKFNPKKGGSVDSKTHY